MGFAIALRDSAGLLR